MQPHARPASHHTGRCCNVKWLAGIHAQNEVCWHLLLLLPLLPLRASCCTAVPAALLLSRAAHHCTPGSQVRAWPGLHRRSATAAPPAPPLHIWASVAWKAALLSSIASASISAVKASSGRRPSACTGAEEWEARSARIRRLPVARPARRRLRQWAPPYAVRLAICPKQRGAAAAEQHFARIARCRCTGRGLDKRGAGARLVVLLDRGIHVPLQVIGVPQGGVGARLHRGQEQEQGGQEGGGHGRE